MPVSDLGFQDLRSGLRARDISPDSVIFTAESNFSLFSSASASVERCSFTSDVPDQDSITSVVSQHLGGHELSEVLSGPDPDPDPNKPIPIHKNSVSLIRKEKAKVQKFDSSEAQTIEDENIAIDSARNSFSQALKECQDQRLRCEALLKKADHRRRTSLDFNNPMTNAVGSSSPRLGPIKKPSAPSRKTGTFPSPGTPNYRQNSVGVYKGWSSERIPLHTNVSRKNASGAFLPYNGRTLPSKWEDAERWILSPLSGDGTVRTSTQRRPKSKSGPLGPPGVAYYQMFSPAATVFEGGSTGKVSVSSPFLAGDGVSIRYGGGEGIKNLLIGTKPCMARSISIHGCSELLSQSSLPENQDAKNGTTDDSANIISHTVSRRDMATQMSPGSSNQSSPWRATSFSLETSSILPTVESQNMNSLKHEIRDVPVDDEQVVITRWSKKNRGKNLGMGSRNAEDWKRKDVNFRSASWEVSEEASKTKIQREEDKITAWENLQKAKTEAAIRKLEMKLEKTRSKSMDKIMNKLRSAQKKAQEMRSSMKTNRADRQPSERAISFRRTWPISSLRGCFTCHAS